MSTIYLINPCTTESEREAQAEMLNFYIKANYGYGRMLDRFAVWMCPGSEADNEKVFRQMDAKLRFSDNGISYREDAAFFDELKVNRCWEHIFLFVPRVNYKTIIMSLCGLDEKWYKEFGEYPEGGSIYLIENKTPRGFLRGELQEKKLISWPELNEYCTPYDVNGSRIIIFRNWGLNIHKVLVDNKGYMPDFPGVVNDEKWTDLFHMPVINPIRYEARFKRLDDGNIRMILLIQHEGRYYDENWSKLELYSDIDHMGNFIAPFKIYAIDDKRVM